MSCGPAVVHHISGTQKCELETTHTNSFHVMTLGSKSQNVMICFIFVWTVPPVKVDSSRMPDNHATVHLNRQLCPECEKERRGNLPSRHESGNQHFTFITHCDYHCCTMSCKNLEFYRGWIWRWNILTKSRPQSNNTSCCNIPVISILVYDCGHNSIIFK